MKIRLTIFGLTSDSAHTTPFPFSSFIYFRSVRFNARLHILITLVSIPILLVGIMSDFNQINEKRPFSGSPSISDLTNQIATSDSFENESEMFDISCSSNLERSSQIFANLPDQTVHNASFSFSSS